MNSKDLNMIEHIDDLKSAGLSSIKIEGRNKKALYVATVVNAYRHVLDGDSPEQWTRELENVSHRPYSTGFYFGEAQQSPDYDGYEQNCVHVGDILDCENRSTFFGLHRFYLYKVLCRNHFEEGETIEALVPGGKAEPIANRAKEIYSFTSNIPLPPGTLLRSKTFLRTSR